MDRRSIERTDRTRDFGDSVNLRNISDSLAELDTERHHPKPGRMAQQAFGRETISLVSRAPSPQRAFAAKEMSENALTTLLQLKASLRLTQAKA